MLTRGFPYRTVEDPTATAFFNDWLAAVASESEVRSDDL